MRKTSLGQRIREEGPRLHRKKSGTPTTGGGVILLLWAICLPLLYWFGLLSSVGLYVFFAGLSFGTVGLLDDLLSLRHRRSLGLSPLQKIVLVSAVSTVLYFAFPHVGRAPLEVPFASVSLSLPPIALFFLIWAVFLWTTNSMNLTDGLDGLATGATILILCGFLVIAPTRELAGVILPLIAILAGFLWVNAHPANLFLGDVGAFALGGVVAALAVATGSALILPLLAGLLVLESGSVILQVACFRLTGKRIFMISPLHHHFESAEGITHSYLLPAVEWPEQKITLRLWIVQALFVGLGIFASRF
jgi:phospho-N-acetylmuramoyl-pentapeptide-transferase